MQVKPVDIAKSLSTTSWETLSQNQPVGLTELYVQVAEHTTYLETCPPLSSHRNKALLEGDREMNNLTPCNHFNQYIFTLGASLITLTHLLKPYGLWYQPILAS